jgi:hypothetical protein
MRKQRRESTAGSTEDYEQLSNDQPAEETYPELL